MEKIELRAHKPMKPTRMTSIEETVQLNRLQQQNTSSSGAIYDRKPNQKALKVLTVAAYILFVSMAAITLSFYYVFIWDPTTKPLPAKTPGGCDNKIVIPESLAIQLANSSEVSAETFLKILVQTYESQKRHPRKQSEKMVVVKELNEPPLLKIFNTHLVQPADLLRNPSSSSQTPITPSAIIDATHKIANTEATIISDSNASPESVTVPFQSSTVARTMHERTQLLDALQASRLVAAPNAKHTNFLQQRYGEDDDDLDDGDDGDEDADYEGSGGRADTKNSSSRFGAAVKL